jgi:4,5-dihydroxyphthalate decarboxylase
MTISVGGALKKLQISLACCDYDRTRALLDGRVAIDGCDVAATAIEPEEAFHRAFKFQEFDISELSLSSHTLLVSRGENAYIAIPAFVSRLFRHSGIYIRTDRGIRRPEDLKGKTLGLPEYQITANVWIRGILQDEYGVKTSDIHWRQGGVEDPGREERMPIKLPPEIGFKTIPRDKSVSQMLESGDLDGMIGARAPSCFLRGAPNVARMFPDFRKAEEDYYRRAKIFPIMHAIGIRKTLVERHPWLPVNVYKAFLEAKKRCWYELGQIGHLFVSLPWGVSEFENAKALMGEDYWSYGLAPNRHVLDAFTRYHFEQHLSSRRVAPEELFAASTLEMSKI